VQLVLEQRVTIPEAARRRGVLAQTRSCWSADGAGHPKKSHRVRCVRRSGQVYAQENARLDVAIQAAHMRTRQTYGPDRLQAELRADGFPAGVWRIKRLRKKLGLRCTQVWRFTTTTDSTHALPVADNVLAQTVATRRPNQAWVTDSTYVPTRGRVAVSGWREGSLHL